MRSPHSAKYKRHLIALMSFLDGIEYLPSATFPPARLLEITDTDIVNFFHMKAFGRVEPGEDDRPLLARSTTLHFMKKAISYFMPTQRAWDDNEQRGNPTKSTAVNRMIQRVKFFEVRREAVGSKARRPMEWEEFIMMLVLIRHFYAGNPLLLVLAAVFTLQWQLIGRIDDVMQLNKSTLSHNLRYPYTLLVKMHWSKNIRDEREVPTQIIFGSMDPLVCPLLNLASFLEFEREGNSKKIFCDRSNRSVCNILERIFTSNLFHTMGEGPLGSHSIRKGAATYASRFGLPKDWIDVRGRWRGKKRQVDTYISTQLPYPDARVASVLCGPRQSCKYILKGGQRSIDSLIPTLVPNITASFGIDVAKVLVLPLLWAAYEGEMTCNDYTFPIIPPGHAAELKRRWVEAGNSADENPVEKVGLAVQQLGDQLVIVPLRRPDGNRHTENNASAAAVAEEGEVAQAGAGHGGGGECHALDAEILFSQQFQLQQRLEDLRQEILAAFGTTRRFIGNVHSSVRRIAVQPVVRPCVQLPQQEQHEVCFFGIIFFCLLLL